MFWRLLAIFREKFVRRLTNSNSFVHMKIVFSEYSARGANHVGDYLITYLLTPWSTVLLQKLTGSQLVKFPAFYGTRRFITTFQSVHHLSLSRNSSIQSIPPHPTSWRYILILSSHLRLSFPSGLFPSDFPIKTLYTSPPPHKRYKPRPSHSPRFYHMQNIGWGTLSSLLSPITSSLLGPILSSTPYSQTPSAYVPPSMSATKFHTHTKQQAKLYFCKSKCLNFNNSCNLLNTCILLVC